MDIDNLDLDSINEDRRRTAAETLAPISHQELAALGEQLFETVDHPWRDPYFHFVEDSQGETIYSGHTGDGFHFLYRPARQKGFWYVPTGTRGMGPIQDRGLKALGEILGEKAN
ncbi:MAG: hypothetical protein ACOYMS_02180 [Terrimicrobiaceae bacterium]